jgi:hypothetical protein
LAITCEEHDDSVADRSQFHVVLALMAIMAVGACTRLVIIEREAISIAGAGVDGLTQSHRILLDGLADYSLTQEFVLQPDTAES